MEIIRKINPLTSKQKKSHEKSETYCMCGKRFQDKYVNDKK